MPIDISCLGFAPTDSTLVAAGDVGTGGMHAATLASRTGITNIGTTTA